MTPVTKGRPAADRNHTATVCFGPPRWSSYCVTGSDIAVGVWRAGEQPLNGPSSSRSSRMIGMARFASHDA